MARMTASASSDPLDPLPFRAGDAAGAEQAMRELLRLALADTEISMAD